MTLLELLSLLRKHLVIVIVLPVLFALVAGVVTLFMPDEYTATTNMYVLSKTSDTGNVTQSELSAGQMLTNDVAKLITSTRVIDDVSQELGLEDLDDYEFAVTSSTTTRVITLSVTGPDAKQAADIANEMVQSVSTTASEIMEVEAVNVIDKATTPDRPSGPRRTLYTLLAAFAGLFLAVAFVVLRDILDVRVRSDEEVTELLGVPVVGHFAQIER